MESGCVMAKKNGVSFELDFKGLKDVECKFEKLTEKDNCENAASKALYEGAGVIADAVTENLKKVLKEYKKEKGTLEDSLGIAKFRRTDLTVNTRIGFDGYDKRGNPNQLKARVLESGRSDQPARPFFRPAVEESLEDAKAAMDVELKKRIKEILE